MHITTEPHSFSKRILRDAVTNGHQWEFIILYLNEDRIGGGTYHTSPIIKIDVTRTYPFQVISPGPDIIAGILAYWVSHTHPSFIFCHKQVSDGAQLC